MRGWLSWPRGVERLIQKPTANASRFLSKIALPRLKLGFIGVYSWQKDEGRNDMAKGRQQLLDELTRLGIAHHTLDHEALFTVEQSKALYGKMPGGQTKNLFIKDKKGRHFLVAMEHNAVVDLKTIHSRIGGQGRVSFGNAEDMMAFLGVMPGSVTLFGIINDKDSQVTVFVDEALLAYDKINAHPLTNEATTNLATADMLRFLEENGHKAEILPRVEA
jgi:Ala-tRNA(Pro) deacylase